MTSNTPAPSYDLTSGPTVLGHPCGLFTLFFSEMWERFSFYGMRALLVYYLTKGFLGYGDTDAYAVYGSYTSLVYMTPFFGGMLADRVLGARLAVILGGLLMAAGHLLMTIEDRAALFTALALLIAGNGFFKPNISTIVGSLYPPGSPRRDGGFTIFYIGINLGASMAPLVCGYLGETYGWHYGFGAATVGMLAGLAVFAAPSFLTQVFALLAACVSALGIAATFPGSPALDLVRESFGDPERFRIGTAAVTGILLLFVAFFAFRRKGRERAAPVPVSQATLVLFSLAAAWLLYHQHADNAISRGLNYFTAVALLVSAAIAVLALARGPLPAEAGAPADPARLDHRILGIVPARWAVLFGTLIAVPLLALLVSGFAPFTADGRPIALLGGGEDAAGEAGGGLARIVSVFRKELSRPAGLILVLSGLGALVYLAFETFRLDKIPRERMFVVLILTFLSVLFWSFFEQAGSSVNLFTDRNVDRVFEEQRIGPEDVGKTIRLQPTQEQLGHRNGGAVFTMDQLARLREEHAGDPDFEIEWTVTEDNVGMGIARRIDEIPASTFQAVNPVFIILFGVLFASLWGFLGRRNLEPSTPSKFALGLLQLALGFFAFYAGTRFADARGMVSVSWLVLGYLLFTTGELCLSPVGLSMVTRLSPAHLVGTAMGTWFLATAFSQYVAAIISQFTGVTETGGAGGGARIPPPAETLPVYAQVFYAIGLTAAAAFLLALVLVPLLKRWMHEETEAEEAS